VVQKIISWKAGKSELICLHGGCRFPVSTMYCLVWIFYSCTKKPWFR